MPRFLSTPSARRATERWLSQSPIPFVSIHALREEGDVSPPHSPLKLQVSIPALREEGDIIKGYWRLDEKGFYPRPPRGGRHGQLLWAINLSTSFYPRPPRGGRHFSPAKPPKPLWFLSTPSARRATQFAHKALLEEASFYPRPPRGGRHAAGNLLHPRRRFYPRPPRGGRQQT